MTHHRHPRPGAQPTLVVLALVLLGVLLAGCTAPPVALKRPSAGCTTPTNLGAGTAVNTGTSAPPPPVTGGQPVGSIDSLSPAQLANAQLVVAAGEQKKILPRGIVIALAVGDRESSGFKNYANDGTGQLKPEQRDVARSMQLPHDAVGHDHGSVGIMQQQYPWWGSLEELMNPAIAASKFYDALLKVPGWEGMPVTVAAQTVQQSGLPDAYAPHEALGWQLLAKFAGSGATAGDLSGAGGTSGAGNPAACPPAGQPEDCPVVQAIIVPGTFATSPTADPTKPVGGLDQIGPPAVAAVGGKQLSTVYVPYLAQAFNPTPYADSERNGIDASVSWMTKTAQHCPLTKFAIVGYSQGAAVAGDLAAQIGAGRGPVGADKVIAVELLADPSYDPDAARVIGPAPTGRGVSGVRPGGFGPLREHTVTVCAPGDRVCDSNGAGVTLANLPAIMALQGPVNPAHTQYDRMVVGPGTTTATQALAQFLIERVKSVPPPPPPSVAAGGMPPPGPLGQSSNAIIAAAQQFLGTPYAWGGGNTTGPTQGIRDGGVADSYGDYNKIGFDCSGLTTYAVFKGSGGRVTLPRLASSQQQFGVAIPLANVQPGDLVFFGNPAHHVGIYTGNGQMINAPQSGDVVKMSPISGAEPVARRVA